MSSIGKILVRFLQSVDVDVDVPKFHVHARKKQ